MHIHLQDPHLKAYFHHVFVPFSVGFFLASLLSHLNFHHSRQEYRFSRDKCCFCTKNETINTHVHCTKPLVNIQHELGAQFCVWKNVEREREKGDREHKAHRLYAITVNKIKLNLFVGSILRCACLYSGNKSVSCVSVWAHVSRLKCILDTTTQYYIKCLLCHPPSFCLLPSRIPIQTHWTKKRQSKKAKRPKRWQTNQRDTSRAKKTRRLWQRRWRQQKSRKSFWMACEVDIAENVNKFN